ncbi:MAG: succinylglutamate-semialdehyde dehydrogenase [Enterobacterales bacterium]|nr:succinylglutamate-semialdehyde dehydrogenase [Enterobacterales bacterium]
MSKQVQFINGNWLVGEGKPFESINPAKNQVVWSGNSASESQVDRAVSAARAAFGAWSDLSYQQRLTIIKKFAEQLDKIRSSLAESISQETGRPLWETTAEVAGMISKITISEKAFAERTGTVESEMGGSKAYIRHKPHGVVAVFGPYNFPGHLPNGHMVPALMAGNTLVFKPSELTPKVAQLTIEAWQAAGLPKGVINLVQGEVETGKALAAHSDIDGLFFTGSSNTGNLLHRQFAGQPGKILALEMGGNNPLIVNQVEDVDAVVHDILQSAFVTAGQRCTCARRVFIEATQQGDAIIERLIRVSENIKIGHYDDEDVPFYGSLVSEKAALDLLKAQNLLKSLGGKVLLEMRHLEPSTGFVSPGIIDMTDVANVPDEEYFGPLVKIYRYQDFSEALHAANATQFGLSAALLSDSNARYQEFFKTIRAGIVNWNRPTTGANSQAPFGGIGASGNHRASAYYAADYCAYPISSVENESSKLPEKLSPGLSF